MANWRIEARRMRHLTIVDFKKLICILKEHYKCGGITFAELERIATEALDREKIRINKETAAKAAKKVREKEARAVALREKQAKEAVELREKQAS